MKIVAVALVVAEGGAATPRLALQEPPGAPTAHAQALVALEQRIDAEERRFEVWRWSWLAAFTAMAAGNLALVPRTEPEARVDRYTGAIMSVAAMPALFLFAQPDPRDACGDDRDRCTRELWERVGTHQRAARGWPMHAATIGANLIAAGVLAFGYERWSSAALQLVVGSAIGELQIYTRPYGAASDR
jgi:hypothetical protein